MVSLYKQTGENISDLTGTKDVFAAIFLAVFMGSVGLDLSGFRGLEF
jgi:hypothetical protein